MCEVSFKIRQDLPCALGRNLFIVGPWFTKEDFTTKSSSLNPKLLLAFAEAERRTFLIGIQDA